VPDILLQYPEASGHKARSLGQHGGVAIMDGLPDRQSENRSATEPICFLQVAITRDVFEPRSSFSKTKKNP
jgi:hypothetical protein